MRIVPDINTSVSGLLWPGPSRRVMVDAVAEQNAELLTSPELIATFSDVIRRQKFVERMKTLKFSPEQLIDRFAEIATVVTPRPILAPQDLRDLDDVAVLACAVTAGADFIVSGDKDLLALREFEGIPILTAINAARALGYPR